jgi:hypothetical protein
MIRLLHILSVLFLALAGLILALCLTNDAQQDSRFELLSSSSALQRFREISDENPQDDRVRESPLVRQARALALYLNPPAPVKQIAKRPDLHDEGGTTQTPRAKPASSAPKFELHGISYHRSRPERSMALVWEPAGGRRWVRQGTQFGHIVIEEITGDSIVYRDGRQKRQMALASAETLRRYARGHRPRSNRRQATKHRQTSAPPRFVRRIRQMPAARVAAKKGLRLGQVDIAEDRSTESR